jgi:hypothetical protein
MKGHYQRPSYFKEVPQIIKGKIVKKFVKVKEELVKLNMNGKPLPFKRCSPSI